MSDTPSPSTIAVRPWVDPVVDDDGFDPRSRYVEVFWLGVLGPTATWLLRRLVAGLERSPEGYDLDLLATAQAMGLGYTSGRTSPFSKALQRFATGLAGTNFHRNQCQFAGEMGVADTDFVGNPLNCAVQPKAGFDADHQQVQRVGKPFGEVQPPHIDTVA